MRVVKLLSFRFISTSATFRKRVNEEVDKISKSVTTKNSTVDFAAVDHHSKLSDKWWDKDGEVRALHTLNPLRVQLVRDGLANTGVKNSNPYLPLKGTKILDVGCGGGLLSEPLARLGAEVTGIDASSELITVAKEHAELDSNLDGKLDYVQTVIEDFATGRSNTYNAVIASEVVEHVNEKELFLKYCIDTLKPGGSIFLTTLNKTLPSWLGGIIAAEHILKLVPKGTHDWNKFITPAEMQCLLETYGCKTKLIHGIFYNPLKNEWFWVASTAINYAIQAVKRNEP